MKYLLPIFISLMFTGCASTKISKLGDLPLITTNNVKINDMREPSQKEYFREGLMSPIQILGDANFQPSLLDYFDAKMENKSTETGQKYNIDISIFRVVDNFEYGMKTSQSAAISGAMTGATGVYTASPNPTLGGTDYITLEIKGRVNEKNIDLKIRQPYRQSAMSFNRFNDKSFKAAIDTCLEEIINKIVSI